MDIFLPGDARGLDPYSASASNVADGSRLSALYDVLVWSDPATGTVRPQMAESLVSDQDTSKWTLTLRPGITFSDGEELNAEAVRLAWAAHLNPELRSLGATALVGVKLTVIDRLQLRIELPSPNANFDRMVSRVLNFIPSPRTLPTKATIDASSRAPVGAGPFKLREWVPKSHMTFDRNPNYWQKGRPYLDSVTFRVNPDAPGAARMIDEGKADLTISTDAVLIGDARDRGLAVGEIQLNGGMMIAFNVGRTTPGEKNAPRPFAEYNLRRAVVLSLSGSEINTLFYEGLGTPAKGIFDSSSPLASIQLAAPENQPAEATRLFMQVTENGSKPLELTYAVPDSPKARTIAEFFRTRISELSKGSVKLNLVFEDIPTFIKRTSLEGRFDATVFQMWADDPEPAMYQFLHSQGGLSNVTGYKKPAVDEALRQARLTSDIDRRSDAYTRVQVELNKDLPFYVYQEAVAAYVCDPKITGLQLFNDGLLLFDRIGVRK
ncbi:ABC transporter substrate-binding protein [Yinghuangia sp. YIM S09857]|uniref:ABC transporter substrate-binding protein n=1 Tax=Yinghuangia sp. YIM S09857 TaxID=3436929 RepID=UPI003F52A072